MRDSPSASPAAASSLVLRSDAGGMATLTLNRPAQFNAISLAMLAALHSTLDAIAADPTVRVVVIAGAGPNFCAGHDLKEMLANSNEAFIGALFRKCCEVMLAIAAIPQPVIARVHGIATAAGCQLVAACDLAVAASDARFATSGINYGLFCATPSVPVSRNISRKQAFEMVFAGEFIDAPTALSWGLINRVAAGPALDAEVLRLAQSLMEKPPEVVAAGKAFFYSQLERTVADAYRIAAAHITDNMLGDAAQEGVAAFIQKRTPDWRKSKPLTGKPDG
jgi:enoyl-CoA hydratase/carnithine racemase